MIAIFQIHNKVSENENTSKLEESEILDKSVSSRATRYAGVFINYRLGGSRQWVYGGWDGMGTYILPYL